MCYLCTRFVPKRANNAFHLTGRLAFGRCAIGSWEGPASEYGSLRQVEGGPGEADRLRMSFMLTIL